MDNPYAHVNLTQDVVIRIRLILRLNGDKNALIWFHKLWVTDTLRMGSRIQHQRQAFAVECLILLDVKDETFTESISFKIVFFKKNVFEIITYLLSK